MVRHSSAAGGGALVADLATDALAATAVVPVVDVAPAGRTPATVVSFTVTYGGAEGLEPVRTAVVADLPDGVRTAATCEDADTRPPRRGRRASSAGPSR